MNADRFGNFPIAMPKIVVYLNKLAKTTCIAALCHHCPTIRVFMGVFLSFHWEAQFILYARWRPNR